MNTDFTRVCGLFVIFFLAGSCFASPCVLIDEGQANATIVVPQDGDNLLMRTATDIQDVLESMTGVQLPIQNDGSSVTGNRILLGQTVWTDAVVSPAERQTLAGDGFILRRAGSDIALVGSNSYGVAYAASEMLERLGARWFLPGPLGEVIPELYVVEFDVLDVREEPSFGMRWVSREDDWNLRIRSNRIDDQSLPQAYVVYPGIYHSQNTWLPHSQYYDSHPEYFALIDGQRSSDPECKLCNSNPDVAVEIALNMKQYLDSNPSVELISLSPTDGQRWCECDDCKALDEDGVPNDQKYSRRQMVLYNRVAAELEKYYPDKKILAGSYNVYTWPPADPDMEAHPNLSVVICHYDPYCLAHPVNDPTCTDNQVYNDIISAWQALGCDIYFYEYYRKTSWLDLPWPVVHTMKEDIPYFYSIGAKGLYTGHNLQDMWSTLPNHYIAASLLWDHTADVNALLDDFYDKFYADASVPMRAYHEALEQQMANSSHHIGGYAQSNAKHIFTRELFEQLNSYLDQARALEPDGKAGQRVDRQVQIMEYGRRLMKFLWLRDRADDATGAQRCSLLKLALEAGNELKADLAGGMYSEVVYGKYFTDNYQIVRELDRLAEDLAGECEDYYTFCHLDFDDKVPGHNDRVYVGSDYSQQEYTFKLNDLEHVSLDGANSLLGFDKCLNLDGTEPLSWGQTLTPFYTDLRRNFMKIECWLKLNSYPAQKRYIVARHFTNGRSFRFEIEPDGKICFSHYQLDGTKKVYSSFSLPLGRWYHVAITRSYESTQNPDQFAYEVNFYINGLSAGSHNWTGPDYGSLNYSWDDPSNRIWIGGRIDSDEPCFDGFIDEFKISGVPSEGSCEASDYLPADVNEDCYVNLKDLFLLCEQWLNSNKFSD